MCHKKKRHPALRALVLDTGGLPPAPNDASDASAPTDPSDANDASDASPPSDASDGTC